MSWKSHGESATSRESGWVMIESDSEYFRRRAGEERLAATRATHPSARQAHLDLADRYAEAAAAIADSVLSIEATMSPSPAE